MCPVKYRTQDTINKSAGSISAKKFGEFHRFVNSSLCWYRIIKQNFVDCKSENIFINSGHLL